MNRELIENLAIQPVDSIFEAHKELGPRLLETAYAATLCHELKLRNIRFERQKPVPLIYKGVDPEFGFRIDVLIEDTVVLELKSVETLLPIHDTQLINYLNLADKPPGFLVNFNVPRLKEGITRRAGKSPQPEKRPNDFKL